MRSLAPALALTVLAGCGGAPGAWVGTWRGDRSLPTPPGKDPSVARTLSVVEVAIEPSGAIRILDAGLVLVGRASFRNRTATVRIESVVDRPAPRLDPARLTLHEGSLRYEGPLDGLREPLSLSRAQPK